MGVAESIAAVSGLLGIAFQIYSSISQVQGTTPIPSWDELVDKNKLLQSKIDAELGGQNA